MNLIEENKIVPALGREIGSTCHFPIQYPPELPISDRREEIIRAIREYQVLVVTGDTGSGKSTQIPKMCLEAGRGARRLIGCTEPRRIAAITLASRVSEELGENGHWLVGYKIRFQDRTSKHTKIKFMTDGICLAEAQHDKLFNAYDTIVIDEAHERTLNIDFLLGLFKQVLPKRPDLKVIITSATIDPEKFSRAFYDAPIIEVSGRTYPVKTIYRPLEEFNSDAGEASFIDQAVHAVDELKSNINMEARGDILVFMPTESDIRDTVQRLEEKKYPNTVVLPLFGRLASSDQRRVFRLTKEEKIVVATNVAETSVTIPRIKYVVDTGLARVSQYNTRSGTQGLPVVPISQASADQRKGRCGRVAAGVCLRLYSEEDYSSRPLYILPEIQRSNLAEVILRMLFLRLGSVQDFPFLDPPSQGAIKDGFAVLRELGAVDDRRRITKLGRTMARLPLDPRLARMLIEARKEKALDELIILTAALSIQDPRERPIEQEAQADQAHAVYKDSRSDFVALLKIWGAVSQVELAGSRNQLRRYCRDNFLSYRRIREWKDIHEEIYDVLKEIGGFNINETPASYEAIHRCVASAYLNHVATRKEKNVYLASKNRQVMLFPGSGLFNHGAAWITAAELVQTSRLFARTAAKIEPAWLEELGRHVCRYSYSEPHWEKRRGHVVAYEKVLLYGLPIVERRKVSYGRINPEEARQIFLQSALVESGLPGKYGFVEHNRDLIKRIEELESKTRRRDLLVREEALYQFFDDRIPTISDVRSFDKFLEEKGGDDFLRMTEEDLLQGQPNFEALEQFPDTLRLDGLELPLRYAFRPGEENDGVTAVLPVHALTRLSTEAFEWLVPGLLHEKVTFLFRALPKNLRRQLVPVGDTARRVSDCLPFRMGNLLEQLSRCTQSVIGVRIPMDQWDQENLPEHLKMRFEVFEPGGSILGEGRDFEALKSLASSSYEDHLWKSAKEKWEKEGLSLWDFGDFPHETDIGKDALGLSRIAYLGLRMENGRVLCRRMFGSAEEAKRSSTDALEELYRFAFAAEIKQLMKDWTFPEDMTPMLFFMGSRRDADGSLREYIIHEIFDLRDPQWPNCRKYQETVQNLKGRIASVGREMADEVIEAVRERDGTREALSRLRRMSAGNPAIANRLGNLLTEMDDLIPPDFLRLYRRSILQDLPRYMRSLRIRGERLYSSPEKDRQKNEQLETFMSRFDEMRGMDRSRYNGEGFKLLDEFRWMLEEYKISLFSPEIKTRFRVSPKRLEEKWQEWISWKSTRA